MLANITLRDRRALVLGLGTIAALVITVRGIPAWWRWRAEVRATAADLLARAARNDGVVSGLPAALDSLEARTARLRALRPAPVVGESPADAGSNLAAYLAEAARGSLVRIDGATILVDSSRSYVLPRVAVDVQATADIAGLAALLRSLEQGPTLVAVRRLQVRADRPDTPSTETEMLTIRLTAEAPALVQGHGARP